MTVRKTTFVIIVSLSLFFLIATFFINYFFLVHNYGDIENKLVSENTVSGVRILLERVNLLADNTADWAFWDDSYQFIDDLNPNYIETNIQSTTFTLLNINAILFLDAEGQIKYSNGYDFTADQFVPVSAAVVKYITDNDFLQFPETSGEVHGAAGVVALSDGTLLEVAAYSILPSNGIGISRGSLVMVRYLTDVEIGSIGQMSMVNLTLQALNKTNLPEDFRQASRELDSGLNVYINAPDADNIYGYALVPGINGVPVALLRVQDGRAIYQAGIQSVLIRMISTAFYICLGSVIVWWILNIRIINPIVKMRNELHKISTSGDYQVQVRTRGNDEISSLAADINQLLVKIQEHREKDTALRLQLESDLKQRAEFTRQLVHELKSPITPILSSSELLVEGLKEDPWARLAVNVYRGALDMNDRLDDLVDLARGEMGTLQLKFETLDMNNIVREMADEMRPLITSRLQKLDVKLPVALPAFRGDETRIRQILRNLLSNATKFTPEKGHITIQVVQISGNIVVKVTDTGRGITPEKLSVIFDEKEKVIEPGDRHSGLGLGLRLAKTLVELHGGTISAESESNKGTTFSFSIPVANTSNPGA